MIRQRWDLPGHRWKALLPITKVPAAGLVAALRGGVGGLPSLSAAPPTPDRPLSPLVTQAGL